MKYVGLSCRRRRIRQFVFVFPIPRSLLLFMPDVGEARTVIYLMNNSAPYKSVNKKTKSRKSLTSCFGKDKNKALATLLFFHRF